MRRRTKRSRKQESTDEDDEVTRCVCGTTESNSNIMIQCESCSVWQHCDCMNLSAKKLPKNYWCEECRPDNHPYYQLFQPKPAANKRPSLGDSFWDLERVSKQPKKRGTLNSRVADLFDMSDMSLFNEQSDSVKDKESEIETPLLGKSQLDKVKDMDAEEEGSIDIEGSEKDKEENHDLKNEEETNASEDLGEDETNGGSVDDVENSNSQTSERTVKKNARRRDTANNSLPPKKRGRKNVNSNGSTSRLSGNTGKKINVEDSQTQSKIIFRIHI
ncbi:hypothetical protein BC833DRAFT_597364 [Globomyces pollinis-pini]|nr:hypothetical protein BC833DRAFT_597364 [Globomyces pollinis-pini]